MFVRRFWSSFWSWRIATVLAWLERGDRVRRRGGAFFGATFLCVGCSIGGVGGVGGFSLFLCWRVRGRILLRFFYRVGIVEEAWVVDFIDELINIVVVFFLREELHICDLCLSCLWLCVDLFHLHIWCGFGRLRLRLVCGGAGFCCGRRGSGLRHRRACFWAGSSGARSSSHADGIDCGGRGASVMMARCVKMCFVDSDVLFWWGRAVLPVSVSGLSVPVT